MTCFGVGEGERKGIRAAVVSCCYHGRASVEIPSSDMLSRCRRRQTLVAESGRPGVSSNGTDTSAHDTARDVVNELRAWTETTRS